MADEELELKANGTAAVKLGNKMHQLRRPTIGEFFKIREQSYEVDDAIREVSSRAVLAMTLARDELAAQQAKVDTEADDALDPEAMLELRLATNRTVNTETLKIEMTRDEQYRGLAIEVFRVLDVKDVPDPDSLPPWIGLPDFVNTLSNHWRAVPLVSGAPSPPETNQTSDN